MDQRCIYVKPIRLVLLLNSNQISCFKGKRYVRRFDPDTVENGHIYSSVKEEEAFIYWVYLDIFCGYVRLRILWAGLIVFKQLDNQSKKKKQCLEYNCEHAMNGELFLLYKVLNEMN